MKFTVYLPDVPGGDPFEPSGYMIPEWTPEQLASLLRPPEKPTVTVAEWSLSVEDMMRMTHKSRRWLFENKNLPFIRVINRKTIIGDETLLKKWIASRRAK